jgi:hypothetical protein
VILVPGLGSSVIMRSWDARQSNGKGRAFCSGGRDLYVALVAGYYFSHDKQSQPESSFAQYSRRVSLYKWFEIDF